jgi:hypothetical protein
MPDLIRHPSFGFGIDGLKKMDAKSASPRHAGLDPASTFFPGAARKKVDPGSSPG